MLTIAKLGVGQQNYYLSKVASGLEDYYSGRGEAPGVWAGRCAARLGLGGRVRSGQLGKLMEGVDPDSGERLAGRLGATRVPGWDLTFSAPKSVSVLYGLGDHATAAEVAAGHDAAVAAGIAYLEDAAVCSRRRVDGDVTVIRAEGLTVAAFRHRTSRAGDPQLHTHALAVNVAEFVDGGWGALYSPPLYRHARTAGFVYQAVLRGELTERLGVTWGEVRNGHAEITGIDPVLLDVFSKRRAEITAAMAARGENTARAAQVAAHATRSAKDYGVDPDTLRQRWADEARAVGVTPDAVRRATGHHQLPEVTTSHLEHAIEAMMSAHGLTEHDASFDRRDVTRAWCEALPPGTKTSLADLTALRDDLLAYPEVVQVRDGLDHLAGHEILYRVDGTPTTASYTEPRWSTRDMLAVESHLLHTAVDVRHADAGRLSAVVVDDILAGRADLSAEQASMVRTLTTCGAGVEVVVGRAGTGKTYALAAAAKIWRAGGYRPLGLALAARAAHQLETSAGIPSGTVAQFLADNDQTPGTLVTDRHVLVVDEAAMVDTRRLARVVAIASHAGAKVVLVGDHHQLPAVEAGGAFAALIGRLGATELVENRRQTERWERQALQQLRTGSGGRDGIAEVLATYHQHGRLHVGVTPTAVQHAMVHDWYTARSQGVNAGMIALRRRDVADLNTRARELLVDDGTVAPRGLQVGADRFAAGDRVVCTRGDRQLGVHNALFATVLATEPDTGAILVQPDGRTLPMAIPHWYLADHVRHAYATTVHKAQGATYDHTLLYGDERLYRQAGYTGLSRGRQRNDLYIVDTDTRLHESDLEQHGQPDVDPDAYQRIIRALHRNAAKTLATDEHATAQPCGATRPLGDLWAERDQLIHHTPPASPDGLDAHGSLSGEAQAARLARRNDHIRYRRQLAGHAAEIDRPGHILTTLGQPPVHPTARDHWRTAAAAIESYRARWHADPLSGPIDSTNPIQRAHAAHVTDTIEAARAALPRLDVPDAAFDEPAQP